jgi:hypothetical protein
MIQLWSINKILRYTGFRLVVSVGENQPTLIGFKFYGWSFLKENK